MIKVARKLRDFTLDVDLEAFEGKTLVLMGSNGSGKTTVLNMAAGLMAPDSGRIEVSDRVLFDSAIDIDVSPEHRNIGYVFQNYALFPHMSVYDNVAFGLRMRKLPAPEIRSKVKAELEPFDMWDLKDVKASRLSGGQKQKVALARSLVIDPTLLLLDEPMSALDIEMHDTIRESLRVRLKRDRITSVVVLHNNSDALALGDRAYVLDRGRVVRSGAPEEVLKQGRIGEHLFG